jgi:hypothetical protein
MSLPASRRKQLQRQRDRALGWCEVTVRVAATKAQDVRDFAAALPEPEPPTDPRQLDLVEEIERRLAGNGEVQDDLFK